MGRVLVLSDARYRPTPDLRAIVFPAVWTAAHGRFATVAAWFFQQFERRLVMIADLRRFRGNILEFALIKGCK
jgi:hypothetical protein